MHHLRSVTIGALLAAAAAAPVATAAAPTHTGTDQISGLRYTLQGKTLTLKIVPARKGASAAGPRLRGKSVSVSCGTLITNPKPNSRNVARGSVRWPKRAPAVRLTLSRNLYSKARWCTVYTPSSLISYVDFKLGRNPAKS